MSKLERIYNSKDVDMLVAIDTIIGAALVNKDFLQTKRSTWADSYFDDIKDQIDTVAQTHLGVDSAMALRQSTEILKTIQANALRDLVEIKVQIAVDFGDQPARKKEILNQLGFSSYLASAQTGDQQALINLLFQYKTSLTTDLKAEITAKGTAAETLDNAAAYADALRDANVTQEGNKGSRKAITASDITAFNEVYSKVIGIAKIASNLYKGNPAMQQQFSFTKLVKTQKNAPAAKKKPEPST